MEFFKSKLFVGALFLAGMTLLVFAFVYALTASGKKVEKRGSAEIGDLAPGRFISLDAGALRYFVIRPATGEIYVVAAPMVDGRIPMPDTYWWRPYLKCNDFGLDTAAGVVSEESRFRCRDADQPADWARRWQWNVRGQHVPDAENTPIDDLHKVRFERSGDTLTFVGLQSG